MKYSGLTVVFSGHNRRPWASDQPEGPHLNAVQLAAHLREDGDPLHEMVRCDLGGDGHWHIKAGV